MREDIRSFRASLKPSMLGLPGQGSEFGFGTAPKRGKIWRCGFCRDNVLLTLTDMGHAVTARNVSSCDCLRRWPNGTAAWG